MSGILDSKHRVMDVIITSEGRRQIAAGELQVRYASFSDVSSCYDADVTSGSMDVGGRIYLEAASLPQDSIVIEADDSGRLLPFGLNGEVLIQGGQLFRRTLSLATGSTITGSSKGLETLSGSAFVSTIDGILTGSIDNLNRLRIIGSWDPDFEDEGFSLGPTNVEFAMTPNRPIADSRLYTQDVNTMTSLFNDPRLSTLPNFKYLPPINKITDTSIDLTDSSQTKEERIANYPSWGPVISKNDAYNALMNELNTFESQGFCRKISFDPTSRENNLLCQMFEVNNDTARKLDVIHFGRFNDPQREMTALDIFFVGRVLVDDNGAQTFVHIFTLVFE